jgi:hypothetical protein
MKFYILGDLGGNFWVYDMFAIGLYIIFSLPRFLFIYLYSLKSPYMRFWGVLWNHIFFIF